MTLGKTWIFFLVFIYISTLWPHFSAFQSTHHQPSSPVMKLLGLVPKHASFSYWTLVQTDLLFLYFRPRPNEQIQVAWYVKLTRFLPLAYQQPASIDRFENQKMAWRNRASTLFVLLVLLPAINIAIRLTDYSAASCLCFRWICMKQPVSLVEWISNEMTFVYISNYFLFHLFD